MDEQRMDDEQTWQMPPHNLCFTSTGEVHVWRANLDSLGTEQAQMWHTLAEEERERAACFYFEQDRQRFVAGRGLLRAILACYLKCNPSTIVFQYSPRGKPALAGQHEGSGLQFNLTHSHALALYAITRNQPIGVDVEYHRELNDAPGIARRFFSTREVTALEAVPDSERMPLFYQIWTRKEAYIKAIGQGLAQPLADFDVMDGPGQPALTVRFARPGLAQGHWRLLDLAPGANYSGALVVADESPTLYCWQAHLESLVTIRNS